MFSDRDKAMVEALVPDPKQPSKPDVDAIAWRRFAGADARRQDLVTMDILPARPAASDPVKAN
jgi:hypothetical protein